MRPNTGSESDKSNQLEHTQGQSLPLPWRIQLIGHRLFALTHKPHQCSMCSNWIAHAVNSSISQSHILLRNILDLLAFIDENYPDELNEHLLRRETRNSSLISQSDTAIRPLATYETQNQTTIVSNRSDDEVILHEYSPLWSPSTTLYQWEMTSEEEVEYELFDRAS